MELNKTARENGLLFIKNILEGYAARGTISETQKRSMVDALKPVSNFEMLKVYNDSLIKLLHWPTKKFWHGR